MSYAGAGLGEFLTGVIIEKTSSVVNGQTIYDFDSLSTLWISAGVISAILSFITAGIVARRNSNKNNGIN